PAPDRNLLFGILALQLDFISRDALITALHAWVLDKAKPLGQILHEQGRLSAEHLQLLDAMVAAHLKAHGNDPQQSLAALSSVSSVKQALAGVADPDVQASLAQAGLAAPHDSQATPLDPHRPCDGSPAVVRYRILRPHAKGGLGEVFVAEDQ